MIEENCLALGAPSLKTVAGKAPSALTELKQPDAIFIGGGLSGDGVLGACWKALKSNGILVANAVTFEGEQKLAEAQKKYGGDLARLEISRAENTGNFLSWKPMKPVTQWRALKT